MAEYTSTVPERHAGAFVVALDAGMDVAVIMIETNAAWAADELAMLDAICGGDWEDVKSLSRRFAFHYEASSDPATEHHLMSIIKRSKYGLKKKPSDYFRSNVWLSITASEADWAVREKLGVNRLLWGSDYPHNEATWPHSMSEVQKTIDKLNVPIEDTRKIMGENAAKLWGFDLAKLQPIADRVGPAFYN